MDLAQLKNADSGSFVVRRQNGDELVLDGKAVVIHMHGKGSKAQVSADYKRQHGNTSAQMAAIQGRLPGTAEADAFKRQAEYLAACTIDVENWPYPGGALAIYKDPQLGYITKQAADFVGDDQNFMVPPSTEISASTSDSERG